jgi:hypothetical protein
VNGGYAFETRFGHLEEYLRSFEIEAVSPSNLRAPGQ